jgi:hypothetical protein
MRAALLVGCYRKSDAADPEIYTSAVVAVLMRYSENIVRTITEPATGLPARLKWLPAIAEIVEACEEQMPVVPIPEHRPLLPEPPIDRANRPSLEELRQKYGPNWGLGTI